MANSANRPPTALTRAGRTVDEAETTHTMLRHRRMPVNLAERMLDSRRGQPAVAARMTKTDGIGYIGVMLPWLKVITIWLLAFSLPVQGWAGVAGLHCELGRAHNNGVVHVHEAGEVHHHPQVVAEDEPRQSMAGSDAGDSGDPLTSSRPGNLADPGDHSCSACGACCSPAALPTMAIDVAEPAPPTRWIAVVAFGRVGFTTSGPDRPPRLILA